MSIVLFVILFCSSSIIFTIMLIFDIWMMLLVLTIKKSITWRQLENEYELPQHPTEQRIRIVPEPYGIYIKTNVIFRSTRFNEFSLSTLESDNAFQDQLNFKYTYIQFLILITSSQDGENFYSIKRINESKNSFRFSCLILARVCYQLNV